MHYHLIALFMVITLLTALPKLDRRVILGSPGLRLAQTGKWDEKTVENFYIRCIVLNFIPMKISERGFSPRVIVTIFI